jgi:hypothetical protein
VDGFFSMTPREAATVTQLPYQHPDKQFPALLDFMAVSHTTLSNTLEWTPRPSAMAVVTAGQEPVFADDPTALAALSKTNFDFHQSVLLPLEARGTISAARQEGAKAWAKTFTNEKIEVQAEASATSLVVISQTYYPAWKAYVDGLPAKIWRANYAFQAVEVPRGNHEVTLRYEDKKFRMGLWVSGFGLLACFGLWMRALRRPAASVG